MSLFLFQWIKGILSKGCKPDNFESHSSLKPGFTNIWGLHSNFVECEFFLQSSSLDIHALCETNLDDSTDSGNFSMRGYLSLIQNDSITHAWSYSLCEKRPSIISRKLQILMYSHLSGLQFDWLYFCLSYSPLLYPSPSSLCMAFDSVSSNLEGLLLIIQSANVFFFGDFNVHPKDWLTYSGRTDIPGKLCYNFSMLNDLTYMVNFPTWIPDWDSHSPALVNFVSSFRLELMYISPIVNIMSGLTHLQISNIVNIRFSAACAAVIVHRNHFFCLY